MRACKPWIALAGLLLIPALSAARQSPSQPAATPDQHTGAPLQPGRIRVAGDVQAASLVQRVDPVYPPIAKTAHIAGTVVLHAIIAKDGSVQELKYISGPPLLMSSAIEAVKHWKYKPTLLNGQPLEVDTTISIVFTLADAPPDAKPIDPQLRADIAALLDAAHVKDNMQTMGRTMFDTMRPQLLKSLPTTPNRDKIVDSYETEIVSLLTNQQTLDKMIDIYAHYLTDDDAKAIAEFYRSQAGQHLIQVTPNLIRDGSMVGQSVVIENMESILHRLCDEYPELQGEAKFCPADKNQKESELVIPPLDLHGQSAKVETAGN